MKKILLVGMARETSNRCPNKMTKPFNDTTLFDIYLDKLYKTYHDLDNPFTNAIIAVNKKDKILWNKAKKFKLEVCERLDSSVATNSILSSNFSYLNNYTEEYVMWVNGCFPFVKPETIVAAAGLFSYDKKLKSLHCVKKRMNWFWNENDKPINIRDKRLSKLQDVIPIYESVQCFHIFNRKYLLDNCAYWDFSENNPYLYIVKDANEFLDIDTTEEFRRCEYEYKRNKTYRNIH